MEIPEIEKHYVENRLSALKRMMFRSGGSIHDAEDIVQEAYTRVLKYHKSVEPANFDKYFNTILNNCLRDFRNAENGHTADMFDEEQTEGVNCPLYSEHVMQQVYELIDTKALVHQEVLNLHFKYEYNAKDISNQTEHSYANCHKIISRFRKELKDLYG